MRSKDSYSSKQNLQFFTTQAVLNLNSVKCIKGSQAVQFCFNKKCQQHNAFTCKNIKCICKPVHRYCQKADINMALQIITEKLQQVLKLNQNIEQAIDKQISRLNTMKKKLWKMIDDKLKFNHLSRIQTQFYKIFLNQGKKADVFKGSNLSILWEVINQQGKVVIPEIVKIKQQLEVFTKSSVQINDYVLDKVKLIVESVVQPVKTEPKRSMNLGNMPISSIINTQNHAKLIGFFTQKVKKMSVLFKASDHKFSMKKYYQICGNLEDTIIICQNQYGRIIGGYTPLRFNYQPAQNQYSGQVHDLQNKSFVFQLTTDNKFPVRQGKNALFRKKDSSKICFGGDFHSSFFSICDCADKIADSQLFFHRQNYINNKYNNEAQNLKIIGNKKPFFRVEQWEVIKVEFESKNQKKEDCLIF